ncbi:hypothetical protein [Sorangium sp. So ce117]|uniref:hypothetical protein n=1 Tax=Sorangium sp. So ce117 TaxID=3133277 RepID=UPI003F639FE2
MTSAIARRHVEARAAPSSRPCAARAPAGAACAGAAGGGGIERRRDRPARRIAARLERPRHEAPRELGVPGLVLGDRGKDAPDRGVARMRELLARQHGGEGLADAAFTDGARRHLGEIRADLDEASRRAARAVRARSPTTNGRPTEAHSAV